MKTREREQARALRREQGLPIKQIARRLGVASSSVSLWVRDIALTAAQHEQLRQQNPANNRQLNGSKAIVARGRERRRLEQEAGRNLARSAEPLHLAGCMLYWAEGARARNQICFSNSDPDMVRFFVTFLRRYFDVADENIKLTCHLFADHEERRREIEKFWLDTCQLPETSLRKSVMNIYSKYSKRKRQNKLPYGTCRVVVSRTSVVQSIYGAIQEYAGFERPAWLD